MTDPPSTILIDGVTVEGVEEFIYFGSKQSSNGYCRPDVLRRIRLACSVMNSLQSMELQFSQYQHQSTPVPKALIRSVLRYRYIDPFGRRNEYTGGFPHELPLASARYLMYASGLMPPMQGCFSDLVCHPLVTSYVIDAYLCLAMLHAWTLEYQHMTLCVWWWMPTKAERQWPAGEDRRVALATSGSIRLRRTQRSTAICAVEIWDRQGSFTERCNDSLGLSDDDDDDEGCKTCVKNGG